MNEMAESEAEPPASPPEVADNDPWANPAPTLNSMAMYSGRNPIAKPRMPLVVSTLAERSDCDVLVVWVYESVP